MLQFKTRDTLFTKSRQLIWGCANSYLGHNIWESLMIKRLISGTKNSSSSHKRTLNVEGYLAPDHHLGTYGICQKSFALTFHWVISTSNLGYWEEWVSCGGATLRESQHWLITFEGIPIRTLACETLVKGHAHSHISVSVTQDRNLP